MNTIFLSTTFFCFSILLYTGCRPDDGNPCPDKPDVSYNYLSDADKAKVPYYKTGGYDTLVYVSNTGDSAVCVGQGVQQYFNIQYYQSNPACRPNARKNEFNEFKFVSNSSLENIDIVFYKDFILPPSWLWSGKVITISISNVIYSGSMTRIEYFIDSIELNNKKYYQLQIFYENNSIIHQKLYYNNQIGVIGFELNQKIWNLN